MAAVRVIDLRDNLAYVLSIVRTKRQPVQITRRGKVIAEILPVADSNSKKKFELNETQPA